MKETKPLGSIVIRDVEPFVGVGLGDPGKCFGLVIQTTKPYRTCITPEC